MKKQSGITLIALAITIIILLILAGITIASLTGENGLIAKVKQSKEKYTIAQKKEELELEIMSLRLEEESKGEQLEKEDLTRLNNDKTDVGSVENFPIEIIYDGYKFSVDENFIVTYVGETQGTIITYTTDPEGYTNKDEIRILIKANNPNGIKTIKYPDGDKLICNGKQEVGIDYKVNKNGTYVFKIVDNENKEINKDIVIERIDKVEPKEFTPTVENINAQSLTIVANAQDGEETEESVKSGIGRYEYYIKESTASKYQKYETTENRYTVTKLKPETKYDIYVVVYDRANNYKKSREELIIETEPTMTDINIDSINGSDDTGDGSKENPYKTLNKITETGIIIKNYDYSIYLSNGKYELPRNITRLNSNRNINIYGNKQDTILEMTPDTGALGSSYFNLNLYRLIFHETATFAGTYEKGWYNFGSSFNNVVFKFDNKCVTAGYWTTFGDDLKFKNCIMVNNNVGNMLRQYAGGSIYLTNCYGGFTTSEYGINSNWNYQTNYITSTPQVDENYRITEDESKWKDIGTGTDPDGSQADLGVYGGEYSWEI